MVISLPVVGNEGFLDTCNLDMAHTGFALLQNITCSMSVDAVSGAI
ncbi:hypothetical protein [Maridesulfovibrio hydrothermalis]|uniref:Uncharacterized protein n=1 Tax=Maridesulfovibrio hydrothermalis AM13 = DSM 14728 TaxID=1121451 RepID=L0RD97_9BACT|nr:hypothetical protein [Maridesulfovibrio hydrothermalis]CCO24175.1 protein of unknown function [Maridesulfovibrio hydrothermalis AM13 = DSM 14728]